MFRIGAFSKMTKTTIKTLHYYDEIGLLKPAFIDKETSYRFYTTEQLIKLHKIIALKQIGLSVNEILSILSGTDIENILMLRKKEIESELNNLKSQLSFVKTVLAENKEDMFMNYQAVIKELPECIVYSKKLIVPNYDSYFKVIPQIGKEITKINPNLKCITPEYCFIVYLDGEYKEKDISIEFCEAVEKIGTETDSIKFKKIQKVRAVTVMHKGPYKTISKAYAYLFDWIKKNDYIVIDCPRESFIDGIWNKENDNEWLTELQIPITK